MGHEKAFQMLFSLYCATAFAISFKHLIVLFWLGKIWSNFCKSHLTNDFRNICKHDSDPTRKAISVSKQANSANSQENNPPGIQLILKSVIYANHNETSSAFDDESCFSCFFWYVGFSWRCTPSFPANKYYRHKHTRAWSSGSGFPFD